MKLVLFFVYVLSTDALTVINTLLAMHEWHKQKINRAKCTSLIDGNQEYRYRFTASLKSHLGTYISYTRNGGLSAKSTTIGENEIFEFTDSVKSPYWHFNQAATRNYLKSNRYGKVKTLKPSCVKFDEALWKLFVNGKEFDPTSIKSATELEGAELRIESYSASYLKVNDGHFYYGSVNCFCGVENSKWTLLKLENVVAVYGWD